MAAVKMADTTSSTALTMKLLIDANPQRRRVLFAEAGKDVVDFLFSLLALPIGATVKLLGKESMVGCFGNLYASVEKLDDTHVQSGAAKDAILCPTISTEASPNSSIFRLPAPSSGQPKSLFKCNNHCCNNYVTDASGTSCPSCGSQMEAALQFAPSGQNAAAGGANGLVMRVVTYTVTDDLTITPMSVISTITQLNTYAKRGGVLQEKTVQLGYKEGQAVSEGGNVTLPVGVQDSTSCRYAGQEGKRHRKPNAQFPKADWALRDWATAWALAVERPT